MTSARSAAPPSIGRSPAMGAERIRLLLRSPRHHRARQPATIAMSKRARPIGRHCKQIAGPFQSGVPPRPRVGGTAHASTLFGGDWTTSCTDLVYSGLRHLPGARHNRTLSRRRRSVTMTLPGDKIRDGRGEHPSSLVAHVMSPGVVQIPGDVSVRDAAVIMQKEHAPCVIVRDSDDKIGIMTHSDIDHKVVARGLDPDDVEASTIMSTPPYGLEFNQTVESAATVMMTHGVPLLLVTRQDQPIAILAARNIACSPGTHKNGRGPPAPATPRRVHAVVLTIRQSPDKI